MHFVIRCRENTERGEHSAEDSGRSDGASIRHADGDRICRTAATEKTEDIGLELRL